MSVFEMVCLDLDNTLIPTKIRSTVYSNLGIDIFDTLSSTLLKKLQYSVIKSIDKIKTYLVGNNKETAIVILSNANSNYINALLQYTPNGNPPKFPILAKYLFINNIEMYSAMDEMRAFLELKCDKKTAQAILSNAAVDNANTRWIWKYTTLSAILLQYKQKYDKQCNRLISFGDGADEATALRKYSTEHNIKCNHVQFIGSPTIHQLQSQWKYIWYNFERMISSKDNKNGFVLDDLNKIFPCDNNIFCSGSSDQISAISTYFELWMNDLHDRYDGAYVMNRVQKVCQRVLKRIETVKKPAHLRRIVLHLRENNEFDEIFIREIVNNA